MEHMLADAGLRMTYLRDPYKLNELDHEAILRDLSADYETSQAADSRADQTENLAVARLTHRDLRDYGHLILARGSHNARILAILGMYDGGTDREDYLCLQTAFVAPAARGRRIMERMVALALLRVASSGPVPQVIVARTSNPFWYRSLLQLSRRFTGATFHPDYDKSFINLDSVRLTQRLARQIAPNLRFDAATSTIRGGRIAAGLPPSRPIGSDPSVDGLFGQHLQAADQRLMMIDLRTQTENTILQDAKRVYARGKGRPRARG